LRTTFPDLWCDREKFFQQIENVDNLSGERWRKEARASVRLGNTQKRLEKKQRVKLKTILI
jgi:hypothetical protein